MKTTQKTQLSAGFAILTLALSACGGNLESTQSSLPTTTASPSASTASASPSENPSPESESGSASPSETPSQAPSPTPETTSASPSEAPSTPSQSPAERAYEAGLSSVVPADQMGNWEAAGNINETFNENAELSYIQVYEKARSDFSRHLILFYNHGQYVGKASEGGHPYHAPVERGADGALIVNYPWPKDGESTSNMTGKTVGVYSWDAGSRTVINTGNLPTRHYQTVADARKDVAGIYSGAAQGVPANASRIGDQGTIKTPSGKIRCSVTADNISCLNDTFTAGTYGGKNTLIMQDNQTQAHFGHNSTSAWPNTPTLAYGTQAVLGDYIFAMDQTGMTVWSSTTGKGFFINRDTYHTFG